MTKAEELKQEKIQAVVTAVADALPPEEALGATEFARVYYAGLAAGDVLRPSKDYLVASALSLWQLGSRRNADEAHVRVLNPSLSENGWSCPHTVVEIVHADMPFLVSSVTGALNHRGLTIHLVAHPVLRVRRDDHGERLGIAAGGAPAEGVWTESYIHVEVDQKTSAEELAAIQTHLERTLSDVRQAVGQFQPMLERLDEAIAELETHPPNLRPETRREALEFLNWLKTHFILVGYREYDLMMEEGETYLRLDSSTGLGILSEVRPASVERSKRPLTEEAAAHARQRTPLFVTKTYNRSKVHRPVHMDYIGVRRFGPDGEVIGERRFIGLFTAVVYDTDIEHIPLVRDKVARVVMRAGFDPSSHNARALSHVFETLPRDELFQVTDKELYDLALGVLRLGERQRLALFVRKDRFERFVSCLVYVPRDRFHTRLRERMKDIICEAYAGPVRAFDVRIGDSPLARAFFVLRTRPGSVPQVDVKELEARLAEAARSWTDRLRDELVAAFGEGHGLVLYEKYQTAASLAYTTAFEPRVAVDDIRRSEELEVSSEIQMRLYRPPGAASERVNFKVYTADLRLLSDIVPMLENMGLKVISEVPYEVRPKSRRGSSWLLDFELITAGGEAVDLESTYDRFQRAFAEVWNGEVEDDRFNHLVLTAGLTSREIVVLRAYARYLRQTGIAFSQDYLADTLARNPEPARLLVELFHARFRPRDGERSEGEVERLQARVRAALNAVKSLDEDRILRRYLNLIHHTLRTNFYQHDDDGQPKPYLAFKLDSRHLLGLPLPRPAFEVWVYSPRVEAVHLRGGKVARGGIRWSDRPEDFRTEILGLMKAQMVKNAVIVPVGAKGGFIVKRPPQDGGREEMRAEAVACYQTMMRGLLDLTDNLVAGEVVPPRDVARLDEDDTYLVVAADKGTATFSDIANGVAAEYDFWLGDAFASGGSAGYDHKVMGITARGAWESVKRHFRELGLDTQSEDFTVVGVGDMSGDVFGNGMLLSEHIRLVGAFNHLHIFVDPDPDPARSFAERQRLFNERLGWNEFDAAAMSSGGAVFDRSSKRLELSPEIRQAVGIEEAEVTPDDLIKALLTAEIDLLWLGGIGTFVKGRNQGQSAAGDRVNDAVRVDARELRCRVVGEGANLGLTQQARIEYATAGGKINTDAIDNSAGVDTSDHEVNIKIALTGALTGGRLEAADRDGLLAAMTDEVAELVLADNYHQTLAISVAEAQGVGALDKQRRMIREMEESGRLDRKLEVLPDDQELRDRLAEGRGLTRPELAVLLAYSKLSLYDELLASKLPDDPEAVSDLLLYFPQPLRDRFEVDLLQHRLRREIIATHITNSMINRVGVTFATRLSDETGSSSAQIARAYTVTRDSFELRRVWKRIEDLDNRVPASLQVEMILEVGRLVERATRWFLRHGQERATTSRVEEYQPGARAIWTALERILPESEAADWEQRAAALRDQGVPQDLSRWVAGVDQLAAVPDIVAIAHDCPFGVEDVARVYYALGNRFALDWLRRRAKELTRGEPWQASAAASLLRELFNHQGAMARRVLGGVQQGHAEPDVEAAGDAWLERNRSAIDRFGRLLEEIRSAAEIELPMLTIADQQLRALAES